MPKEETAEKLVELFPEKAPALAQHYADYDHHLLAHLFFADEIQKNPTKEVKAEFSSSELSLAKSIVEGMSGDFKAEDYKDEYRERVKAAIEQKIAGKEIVKAKEGSTNVAANLMEALQASLKGLNKPPKKVSRKAPAAKKEKRA